MIKIITKIAYIIFIVVFVVVFVDLGSRVLSYASIGRRSALTFRVSCFVSC